MSITDIAVILASVSMIIGTFWYVVVVIRGDIVPVPAAWLIFTITMAIGFWSYWNSPVHSWTGNIGNLTGVISTFSNFTAVLIAEISRRNLRIVFTPFQKKMLVASAGILVLWFILRFVIGNEIAAAISNCLTQLLMIFGYVIMAERLWKAERNPESLFTWIMICIASVFSLVPAYTKGDLLGLLYAGRATITSAITVWLIVRIIRKVHINKVT